MCTSCGCSNEGHVILTNLQSGATIHMHEHMLDDQESAGAHHVHDHPQPHRHGTTVTLEQAVLAKNDRLAEQNRKWLASRNILALNLVSAPGAGKTTLLERTIRDCSNDLPFAVIEGDQQTLNDARRIQATGCPVVQINTGLACHLDAAMVAKGLLELDTPLHSVVMIENVGNLVCPALFDLGELAKVAIVSVTEGDDKPIKYPYMFRASRLMILNKIDLLPHVQFNEERCLQHARQVNPRLEVLRVSATRGDGLEEWYAWLRNQFERLPAFPS